MQSYLFFFYCDYTLIVKWCSFDLKCLKFHFYEAKSAKKRLVGFHNLWKAIVHRIVRYRYKKGLNIAKSNNLEKVIIHYIITRNTIALARIDFRYLSKQENYKYICHSVKFALNIDFPGRLHRNCIGISYKSRPRI